MVLAHGPCFIQSQQPLHSNLCLLSHFSYSDSFSYFPLCVTRTPGLYWSQLANPQSSSHFKILVLIIQVCHNRISLNQLNQQILLFFIILNTKRPRSRCQQQLVSSEVSLLCLHTANNPWCLLFFLCMYASLVSVPLLKEYQ